MICKINHQYTIQCYPPFCDIIYSSKIFFDKKKSRSFASFLVVTYLPLSSSSIYFDDIEQSFEEEIALKIDEELDNVRFITGYLLKIGWIEENNTDETVCIILLIQIV